MKDNKNGLVKSFGDSLDKLKDLSIDFFEAGLDSILTDSLLKELPIFNWICTTGKTIIAVRDSMYMNKVLKFFKELKSNRLTTEQIQKHRDELDTPEKYQKELEVVMMYIDSCVRESQVSVLARIYQAYLMGIFTYEVFDELIEVNRRVFVGDYELIGKIACCKSQLLTEDDSPAIERLSSMGLVFDPRLHADLIGNEDVKTGEVKLTPLGELYARYLDFKHYNENERSLNTDLLAKREWNVSKYTGHNEFNYINYVDGNSTRSRVMDEKVLDHQRKGFFEYTLSDGDGTNILGIRLYDRENNNVRCFSSRYYSITRFLPQDQYFTIDSDTKQRIKTLLEKFTAFENEEHIEYKMEETAVLKQTYYVKCEGGERIIRASNLARCCFDLRNNPRVVDNYPLAESLVSIHQELEKMLVYENINSEYLSLSDTLN